MSVSSCVIFINLLKASYWSWRAGSIVENPLEAWSLVPALRQLTTALNSRSKRSDVLFWPPRAPTLMWHVYTNIHTSKKIK